MSDDICFLPATEMASLVRSKRLSPVEIITALLDRIDRVNAPINAFVTLMPEKALEQAAVAASVLSRTSPSELPALFGLPVTVKDLTPTAGVRTTFGSKHYADHVPDEDGVIWARLKSAGAILLGKTTTPEFGMGTVTESPLTGRTSNPWDVTRTTGGSSGGAAAAVAAGMGPLATGSDGGGSIRVPASYCGVVGLKCSRGRIPIYSEANPFETVDVVGPITRTVADNALMLTVVAGPHPYDPFSLLDTDIDYLAAIADAKVEGLRIAISADLGNPPIEEAVREAIEQAGQTFVGLGAHVDAVELDLVDPMEYFKRWWGPFIELTVRDNVQSAGGDMSDSDASVLAFISEVAGMTAIDHLRVQLHEREKIHRAFADVFLQHDLLLTATTPSVAFVHPGPEGGPIEVAGKRVREPSLDNQRCTEAVSHAGYPAVSVPCGFSPDGLPIGLQIIGPHGADAAVLRAAAAFEAVQPWAEHRPPQ